jgi:methionine aminotransferase
MSKMAADHGAINLSQGYPDFDGPQALRDRVAWHMAHGHNQYSPLAGVPELRQAIADKVEGLYGHSADPATQVAVTPGATEAIYAALTACVATGDEVILFDPSYDTYEPGVCLNGGRARRLTLHYPDFAIDWDQVGSLVNGRTRAIVFNTPHNPTGRTWSAEDLQALRDLVKGTDILLISDEVYEHITFDGIAHQGVLSFPDLAERAFCISSFGKTYHVTGWRIGYCVAPPDLMTEFLKMHQFINFSANAPLQYAIADFLRDCPQHHRDLGGFYQHKRDLFLDEMKPSRFELVPSTGTYFQLADYSRISDLPDREFAEHLTREHGVAAIPISVFYENPPRQNVVRFCFAKEDTTLKRAARLLSAL